MENLMYKQTNKTPDVFFFPTENTLRLVGRILPENPLEFFEKITSLMDSSINNKFNIELDIDYFNSGSRKHLLHLCKKSKSLFEKVNITWFCEEEDDEIIEFISEFSEILEQEVKIIKK